MIPAEAPEQPREPAEPDREPLEVPEHEPEAPDFLPEEPEATPGSAPEEEPLTVPLGLDRERGPDVPQARPAGTRARLLRS